MCDPSDIPPAETWKIPPSFHGCGFFKEAHARVRAVAGRVTNANKEWHVNIEEEGGGGGGSRLARGAPSLKTQFK